MEYELASKFPTTDWAKLNRQGVFDARCYWVSDWCLACSQVTCLPQANVFLSPNQGFS